MIRVFNCSGKNYLFKLSQFLEKRKIRETKSNKIVTKILREIKKNKIKALLKYEKKFSKNHQIKISKKKLDKTIKSLDVPIHSVGIYVPANLPSTVLMNGIPAKLSNVKRIVLANPKLNGKLNSAVLYAAKKVGIKEIYSMGGAQAIGSLAYIQKVNKIIGPGNIYVTKAKRIVFGDVGIEGMIAGPSEITVLADNKTNINEVITSLVSQAEHDINAQCILVTKNIRLIKFVNNRISNFNCWIIVIYRICMYSYISIFNDSIINFIVYASRA